MMRQCSKCHEPYTRLDFVKEESKGMEAERKALGLEGVRFLYYHCSRCGHADIFVDLHPLDGESVENFTKRRDELEAAIQQFHADNVGVTLTQR
jgi:hypothetical protein